MPVATVRVLRRMTTWLSVPVHVCVMVRILYGVVMTCCASGGNGRLANALFKLSCCVNAVVVVVADGSGVVGADREAVVSA